MTMAVSSLPLLHKYVFSPQDDMELKLTKLKFRLCVKEVSDVLRVRAGGAELGQTQASDDDESPSTLSSRADDSGIGIDYSSLEESRILQHFDEIPEELVISRPAGSTSDEAFAHEAFSSPSSESCYDDMEREDAGIHLQTTTGKGGKFQEEEATEDGELFEINNISDETNQLPTCEPSSPFTNEAAKEEECEKPEFVSFPDENESSRVEDPNEMKSSFTLPLEIQEPSDQPSPAIASSDVTKSGKSKDIDVSEALRILNARIELPKISARKAVVTFSCWNVADLVRTPQKISAGPGEVMVAKKPKSELQATNEKIFSREKKLAEMYKKIKERDDEDQRMLEEFLKKQKTPVADPLPLPLSTAPSTTLTEKPEPLSQLSLEKEESTTKNLKEDLPGKADSRAEEPPKKRKKQSGILHNVVHSLQRRFSKRGRETVAS